MTHCWDSRGQPHKDLLSSAVINSKNKDLFFLILLLNTTSSYLRFCNYICTWTCTVMIRNIWIGLTHWPNIFVCLLLLLFLSDAAVETVEFPSLVYGVSFFVCSSTHRGSMWYMKDVLNKFRHDIVKPCGSAASGWERTSVRVCGSTMNTTTWWHDSEQQTFSVTQTHTHTHFWRWLVIRQQLSSYTP